MIPKAWFGFLVAAVLGWSPAILLAQELRNSVTPRIVTQVNDSQTVTLRGNVHPLAQPAYDQGDASPSQPMLRMMMVLKHSDEQEASLEQLLKAQQTSDSPNFHRWLTPVEFGVQFGPADSDLAQITQWLAAQGFENVRLGAGRTVIEFSGTVRSVEQAFRTSIHHYQVDGQSYSANATDPQIPAALAPVIGGIVTLNSFPRHPNSRLAGLFSREGSTGIVTRVTPPAVSVRTAGATANPLYTVPWDGSTAYAMGPADFAKIYNVNPLLSAATPIDGTGQTIAIVGETDIQVQDFVNFRQMFGLPLGVTSGPTGTQYLNVIHNGVAPGITSKNEEVEANLDTQWSGAVAPGATIDLVVSTSTETAAGIDLSTEYIIDNNLAPVMSTSYGLCELYMGTAANAFYNALYQQAAAQGITVLTSSGDSGGSSCNRNAYTLVGLSVSGLTSTPYNVSVGGTDFYMPGNASKYWNASNAPSTWASALGYIPEIPWNLSCADPVLSATTQYAGMSPELVCDTVALINSGAGGGGKSSCTQSDGTNASSCLGGYPKPEWQTGPGVPADGARDVPDVSLFASSGIGGSSLFNSFYVVCQQDLLPGTPLCSLNTQSPLFLGIGGTSASTPAFAGVLALVNQKTGSRLGNANYVLYKLAAQQNTGACNSTTGSGSSCIFNDVTTGSIAIPCKPGTADCIVATQGGIFGPLFGILNGYPATTGYDLATGLGSVNVANLVNGWSGANQKSSATSLTLSSTSAVHGSPITATATVTSPSGTPTGLVSVNGATLNGSVGEGVLANGVMSQTLHTLPGGNYSVTAHYAGDGNYAASDSPPTSVTITPEPSTGKYEFKSYNPWTGDLQTVTSAPYGTLFIVRTDVAGASGFGISTGTVTIADGGAPLGIGTYPLNQDGAAEDLTIDLLTGKHTFQSSFSGDASFNPSTFTETLTVTPMVMECPVMVANTTVLQPGWNLHLFAIGQAAPTSVGKYATVPSGTTVTVTGTISFYSGTKLLAGPIAVIGHGGGIISQSGGILSWANPAGYVNGIIPPAALTSDVTSITATYSGDANHSGCTTPALALTYQPQTNLPSQVSFNNLNNTVVSGANFSVTVTVQAANSPPVFEPPYPVATGTIQMSVDGKAVGSPVPLTGSGALSLSTSTAGLALGSHTFVVSYLGDATYAPSVSYSITFTIVAPDFSLQSFSNTANAVNGGSTNPTSLQVSDLYGFTGAVTFSCTGLPRGTNCNFSQNPLNGTGTVSLTISTTKASAVFGGPASDDAKRPFTGWMGLTGGVVSACLFVILVPGRRTRNLQLGVAVFVSVALVVLTSCGSGITPAVSGTPPVVKVYTNTFLSQSNPAPAEGANDTFTAVISSISNNSPTPTGTVQFIVDSSTAGSPVPVNAASASFTTSFATPGFHTVSASYSGDNSYLASSSGPLQISVPYANGTAPGSYSINVTGTSGSLSHTVTIYLFVQ